MARKLTLLYGTVAYAIFFVTFLYAIGFINNLAVPKSIDSGTPGALWPSVILNLLLLSLFAVQHSGMARPEFKHVWTKMVPRPIERSTFVLFACAALILLYWQWRPLPVRIWSLDDGVLRSAVAAAGWIGWAVVLLSTFMIHHFDLFGLRQVYRHFRGREQKELGFRTPGLYNYVRHPIMLGFLIAFWATPDMSAGRLLFAAVTTLYIVAGIHFEERDLVRFHGARYEAYKQQVPAVIPSLGRKTGAESPVSS